MIPPAQDYVFNIADICEEIRVINYSEKGFFLKINMKEAETKYL